MSPPDRLDLVESRLEIAELPSRYAMALDAAYQPIYP